MMTMQQFAPLMFGGLIAIMLIGFPVAFSLAALGLGCGYFAVYMGWFPQAFMTALPLNVFGILSNDLLLAIPFFTLMGTILERCGLAEDMLDSMGQMFGTVKGGLGYSVIIVGFILGAITGTVAGQVIAMAMISLPVMMRWKYDMRYATGVLAASGTITQLVPPSLVLIVLADQLGKSVGDMYKGAWGPSILQVSLFAAYTFLLTRLRPEALPGIPKESRELNGWPLYKKCLKSIVPSAVLIFTVLERGGGHPHRGGGDGGHGGLFAGLVEQAPDLGLNLAGHGGHHAADCHGGLHPDRLARVLAGVPGGRWRHLD
jgi:tripartite ATP-independent transporter DctM subunit